MRYWAKYLDLLDTKPLATRMMTGFVIGTFGDVLSQWMSGGEHFPPLHMPAPQTQNFLCARSHS